MKLYILAGIIGFTAGLGSAAFAQSGQVFHLPNDKYQNEALNQFQQQQAALNRDKGFVRPNKVLVSIVNHPYFEKDQFGIQLRLPDTVSGCYTFSPLEYEASYIDGNFMEITVKHYRKQKIVTTNPNQDCPSGYQNVSALVVLDKNDLKEKGVYEIRFSNGGAIDRYTVIYHEDRIEFIPTTMTVFKAEKLEGPVEDRLIAYTKDSGVVALHVPMADKNSTNDNAIIISELVSELALQKGLIPLSEDISSHYPNDISVFYFKDNQGSTLRRLDEESFVDLGSIRMSHPLEGSNAVSETGLPLRVFATLPGNKL